MFLEQTALAVCASSPPKDYASRWFGEVKHGEAVSGGCWAETQHGGELLVHFLYQPQTNYS